LGAVAQQHGIAASLHGTGGAWMIVAEQADAERFHSVVVNSMDRKVCNTLNVCCVLRSKAKEFVPIFVNASMEAASKRQSHLYIHADAEALALINPASSLTCTLLDHSDLATEWEWENDPECALVIVDNVQQAIELFNRYAPKFIISVISEDAHELQQVWREADAPFVGNGITRWVDGQFALDKPELGLSNWQSGRILGRGGILSGDSVFSVRYMVDQRDIDLHR
jgi:glutamate-5-semialdehyde dehydrogenase